MYASPGAAALATVILVLTVTLSFQIPARADWAGTTTTTLPGPLLLPTVVATDDAVYALGGCCAQPQFRKTIIRYNPHDGTTQTMAAVLPSGRFGASGIWDGTHIYIFGGGDSESGPQIVRYDPITDVVALLPISLPSPRGGTAAVWDGNTAYIIGGYHVATGEPTNEILRYHPASGALDVLASSATLKPWASAIYDGNRIYLFGGWTGSQESTSDRVLEVDPIDGTVVDAAQLPHPVFRAPAIWDGRNAYILGGEGSDPTGIIQFNSTTKTRRVMSSSLPAARTSAGAAWTPSGAVIIGGRESEAAYGEAILRYVPRPSVPRDLDAGTESLGTVHLEWREAEFAGPNAYYRVYRQAGGQPWNVIGETLARSFDDDHCRALKVCRYYVVAVDDGGEGDPSARVRARGSAVWLRGVCLTCPTDVA